MIDPSLVAPVLDTVTPLSPIPFPVYFITKDTIKWGDLLGSPHLPVNLEEVIARSTSGNDIWAVQTYIQLKRRGLDVHLSSHYVPNAICVAPYHYLRIKDFHYHSYVVASRLDSARPEICERQTVLNRHCIQTDRDHFIPQWPLPGIKPRDPSRGSNLEVVDFKGDVRYNLAEPFRTPEFSHKLSELGLHFVQSSSDPAKMFVDYTDYRASDLFIAVRNATFNDLGVKPACKLINAWFGGCPAILGPEPAYQELRESELDYIEVRSPEQAIDAIRRLKLDPSLYVAMVRNGYRRALEFTADAIAKQWQEYLSGPVAEDYLKWKSKGVFNRRVGRPLKYAMKIVAHRKAAKHYLYQRDNGERLFPIDQ
jgi:hypothetical protein